MKKFLRMLIMAAALFAAPAVQGQRYNWNGPLPYPASGDFVNGTAPTFTTNVYTVTNTGTDTAHCKVNGSSTLNLYNYLFQSLTWGFDLTKVSGTAGGTFTLYGCNETGTGAQNGFTAIASYTITTTTNQSFHTVVTGNPWTNYWLVMQGTGTEVFTWFGTLLER